MGKLKSYLYDIVHDIIEKNYVHDGNIEYKDLVISAIEDYITYEIYDPIEVEHLEEDKETLYLELLNEFDMRVDESFVHDKQEVRKFLEDLGIKTEDVYKYFLSDPRVLTMWRKKLPKSRIRSWIKNVIIPKYPELEYMRQTEIYTYENKKEKFYPSINEFKKGLNPIDSLGMGRHKLIKDWLYFHNIKNYTISDDYIIDVNGSVDLNDSALKIFPEFIQFGKIDRGFYCDGCKLTSLRGCPKKVCDSFSCGNNNLTSLDGCPKEVDLNFWCEDNDVEFTAEYVRSLCNVKGYIYA